MHKIHTRNYNGLALMSIFGRHRRQAHLSARHPASLAFASNRETVETTTASTEPTPPNFTKLRPEVVPCSWCSLRLQCQKNSQLIFFWDFTMSDHVVCIEHITGISSNAFAAAMLLGVATPAQCRAAGIISSNLLKVSDTGTWNSMKRHQTAPTAWCNLSIPWETKLFMKHS